MFEKEAEFYAREKYSPKTDSFIIAVADDAFKDGAEFGYNKAKVEVEDSYRESLCNSELNLASVTEQLEELEKANEWHYPSKGEYPKEPKRYLCKIECNVGTAVTYECSDYDVEYNSWKDSYGDVIAWKEIVLPELKEK